MTVYLDTSVVLRALLGPEGAWALASIAPSLVAADAVTLLLAGEPRRRA